MLCFSTDALPNRALFMSDLNDINIYVEDTGKESEYEEIFERVFEKTLKLSCIFPLGGKKAVVAHHKKEGLRDSEGKLNVFIVDGDFDNLWDDEKIESPNLIYLSRYNIESYLISKEATTKYMRMCRQWRRAEAESRVDFDAWREEQKRDASKLFILLAVAQRYTNLPNVTNASDYLDAQGHLCEQQYERFKQEIAAVYPSLDEAVEDIKRRVKNKFDGDDEEKFFSIICGKYLYESLCRHLQTVNRKNINRSIFKNLSIANFDISALYFLRDKVNELRSQPSS